MFFSFGPGMYRLMLALLVVVHHTTSLGLGAAAVYSFFALSGYWMYAVWVQRYGAAHHGYRTFMTARLLRLLPMFWLSSILGCAVDIYLGRLNVGEWWAHMADWPTAALFVFSNTFLLGYNWNFYQAAGSAWSLDVELQFYILVPLLVILVRRIQYLCVVLGIATAWALQGSKFIETYLGYSLFFYVGMLAANFSWVPTRRQVQACILITLSLLLVVVVDPDLRPVLMGGSRQTQMYRDWNNLFNAVVSLALTPLTIWSVSKKTGPIDRMQGDMSYAVYLIHPPLVVLYSSVFGRGPSSFRVETNGDNRWWS